MKLNCILFLTAIVASQACPYLGYSVGGDNPHGVDNEGGDAAAPCDDEETATSPGRSLRGHAEEGNRELQRGRGRGGRGRGGRGRGGRRSRSDSSSSGGSSENEDPVVVEAFDTAGLAIPAAQAEFSALVDDRDRLGPQLVRLGFHDCVVQCDGCIDMENVDNRGLDDIIDFLEPFVTKYSQHLTRPDVWALASMVAAETMQPSSDDGPIEFVFEYIGREECDGDVKLGPSRELPSVHETTPTLLDYFDRNFNFTAQAATAIMGAHTLGRLRERNSGLVDGRWVPNETRLDNQFLQRVENGNFDKHQTDSGQYVWRFDGNNNNNNRNLQRRRRGRRGRGGFGNRGGRTFFLNADLALAYDFTGAIDELGEVTCSFDGTDDNDGAAACAIAETAGDLERYADDNRAWLIDFRDAYEKMVTNGYGSGDLQLVTG
mmetsp:Transcript_3472/g.9931  ORF Transcript_3472/g.9931 Transcript_3472/m.9931 type:complete len:432 (+) Transcript_3472:144-1439(+)